VRGGFHRGRQQREGQLADDPYTQLSRDSAIMTIVAIAEKRSDEAEGI